MNYASLDEAFQPLAPRIQYKKPYIPNNSDIDYSIHYHENNKEADTHYKMNTNLIKRFADKMEDKPKEKFVSECSRCSHLKKEHFTQSVQDVDVDSDTANLILYGITGIFLLFVIDRVSK